MKQVMNYNKDNGLLNMIRRTDPMIKRYGHDQSPAEMEADKSRNRYKDFTKYINKKYGNNSLLKLFESNLSDGQKIQQIDQWWSEYENR
jgi:hypothetical protein